MQIKTQKGAWLAWTVECALPDLRVRRSSPTLGVDNALSWPEGQLTGTLMYVANLVKLIKFPLAW